MNSFQQLLLCPACGSFAKLTTRGSAGLRGAPEAAVYVCADYPSCDTYVGCHPGTDKPLGTMAGALLRGLRKTAHRELDHFWKSGQISRSEAYRLLAEQLDLSPEEAHIGMLNEEQCRSVVEFFGERPWKRPKR